MRSIEGIWLVLVSVLWILFCLGVTVAAIYAIWHFVAKFW